MLDVGGRIVLKSELVVKGDSDGKPALKVEAEIEEFGVLLDTELNNGSEANELGGTAGRIDGKVEGVAEVEVKLGELVVAAESKGGASGKLGAPFAKGRLKLGYGIGIGCGMEEGIDNPGGGRSKDCWCI